MAEGLFRHRVDEVRAKWKLAQEQLLVARRTQDIPRAAVSHAYYAMFHAMSAALLSRDIIAYTHSGIIQKFNAKFIKPKHVPAEWSKVIEKLFKWRQDADYEALKVITRKQATEAIKQATKFLKVVRKLLGAEVKD